MPVPMALRRAGPWLAARGAPWGPGDWATAVVLAVATLLRWPDRARYLTTWDSASFALALQDYDVRALRPHAPGYPVYIAAGHVANWLVPDVNAALVGLSLAFTALAGVLLYGFVRRLGSRRAAIAAAVLLVAAPAAYTNSLIAANYAADAAFSVAIAWLAWECRRDPTPRRAVALVAVFALGLGVRQSLLFFLAPVALWGVWRGPWDWRAQLWRLGPAAAAGAGVVAAWMAPMLWQSGGLAAWRAANAHQTREVVFARTAFNAGGPAFSENTARVLLYLRTELHVVLPVALLLLAAAVLMARRLPTPPRQSVAFLALWGLPSLGFFLLVFSGYGNGPSGYILVTLPALAAALSLAVDGAWSAIAWPPVRPLGVALLAGLCLPWQAAAWDEPVDFDWHAHDEWAEAWDGLRAEYPANETIILTWWSSAHVWWYFQDYAVYSYAPLDEGPGGPPMSLLFEARGGRTDQAWYTAVVEGPDPTPHPVPPGTRTLVIWDFELAGENGARARLDPGVEVHEDVLQNGWRILVAQADPERPNVEDYFGAPLNRPRAHA